MHLFPLTTRKILDMDLDIWRRRGGDLDAGKNTVGNDKPGVGIEERYFSQDESSVTHLAALRVQVRFVNSIAGACTHGDVGVSHGGLATLSSGQWRV